MMRSFFISVTGLFFYALLLFITTGCTKANIALPLADTVTTTPPQTNSDKKYLALGDSYTIGQGVSVNERFPAQTINLLKQSNIVIKDPEYIAMTGWTTQNLITAISQRNPQGPYDIVTLLIGVNDQYQRMDTGGYRIRFIELLNTSIKLAGNKIERVIILSIPDYSVTPFVPPGDKARVRRETDQFNNINKEISLQNNIKYLDITPSTREAETDPSLIATDGLHPSGKEYKKWAERLAVIIKPLLQ